MFQWNDNYIMGIDEFDEEHQNLFSVAKRINEKVTEDINSDKTRMFLLREGVKYLNNYFAQHARKEEGYMLKIGYERYMEHKQQHEDFERFMLPKFQNIIDSDTCNKSDIIDFIGNGIGWLLEHIATADMAIVGKGPLSRKPIVIRNFSVLEEEFAILLTASFKMSIDVKAEEKSYQENYSRDMIFQKLQYSVNEKEVILLAGIETTFLIKVGKYIYGDKAELEMELLLRTLQIFASNFWKTFIYRFSHGMRIETVSDDFLNGSLISKEIIDLNLIHSILFSTGYGSIFLSSNISY